MLFSVVVLESVADVLKKPEDISYVTRALHLDLSDAEAAKRFTKVVATVYRLASTVIDLSFT